MDNDQAAELLRTERVEVERLLQDTLAAGRDDRDGVAEAAVGDLGDVAQPRTEEAVDSAVVASLYERLAALDRADLRLAAGTYGLSVRSGRPIPDDRLEVEPAAELTVDEAQSSI